MTKLERLEDNLYNSCETITTIICSNCKTVEDYPNCDGYEAVEVMIRDGWYATASKVLCPKCNNKNKTQK